MNGGELRLVAGDGTGDRLLEPTGGVGRAGLGAGPRATAQLRRPHAVG